VPQSWSTKDPTGRDIERQVVLQDILERSIPRAFGAHQAGMLAQYKKMQRSILRIQAQLHDITSIAERFYNLMNWTHPRKTAMVLCGMLVGIAMLLLMPNRLVLAIGFCDLYMEGFWKHVLFPMEKTGAKKLAKSDIQLLNLLRSIPNHVEVRKLFALRKRFYELDVSVQRQSAHIDITHSLQVKWQGLVFSPIAFEVLGDRTAGTQWNPYYAVVAGTKLRIWKKNTSALHREDPLITINIMKRPLTMKNVKLENADDPDSRTQTDSMFCSPSDGLSWDDINGLHRFSLPTKLDDGTPFLCHIAINGEDAFSEFNTAIDEILEAPSS
jgi:hypothetical protein